MTSCRPHHSQYLSVYLVHSKVVVCVIHIFTTNILTSRKGITNIKKGIANIKERVTGDATDISGKHWQQTLANNGVLRRMLGRSYKHCGAAGKLWGAGKIW